MRTGPPVGVKTKRNGERKKRERSARVVVPFSLSVLSGGGEGRGGEGRGDVSNLIDLVA